jgi:hypothetical protein
MCLCKRETARRKVPSKNKKNLLSILMRNATSLHFYASLTLLVSLTLVCIVGSEYKQYTQQAWPLGGDESLYDSVHRYFETLYQARSTGIKPVLTDDDIRAYYQDGFVVVSGLLENYEMSSLVDAGESLATQHIEEGKLKDGNFQLHEFGPLFSQKPFRDVALRSKLPRAAAELLQLDSATQNLRVLKDVFLAKGHESKSSCGWHVDDQLFWPSSYQLPTTQLDQSGINAWIALDDMPIRHGGSMAVSPGSHAEDYPWKSEALNALNFDDKLGNGISKDDLFELIQKGKIDSCGLEKVAPHVYDGIEVSKREFNFKRGDVIFMNRWLFHKTTDVTESGKQALRSLLKSQDEDHSGAALFKRYSIRYVTGTTSLPGGFMTEMSVLHDEHNLAKELNEVSGGWYPKCWPSVDVDVDEKINHLTRNLLPVAQEKLGAIMAELMGLFKTS